MTMTLELASERVTHKPWGKTDLRPWSELGRDGAPVGELWFERADPSAPEPILLLKLPFTDQALSIQVHPNDAFARQIGLPHGKTEAWYILSADPEAKRPRSQAQADRIAAAHGYWQWFTAGFGALAAGSNW
jgi:mannose-6-phosphate isomerase